MVRRRCGARRLAGQGLADLAEARVEQREDGTGGQFVHPPAARGHVVQRSLVIALDQLDRRALEQGLDESGDVVGGRIEDVGVEEHDDLRGARSERRRRMASPLPLGPSRCTTRAPWWSATVAVSSLEWSLTTMSSSTRCSWTRTMSITAPMVAASFLAGTITATVVAPFSSMHAFERRTRRGAASTGRRCCHRTRLRVARRSNLTRADRSGKNCNRHPERLRDGPVEVATTSVSPGSYPFTPGAKGRTMKREL